MSGEAHPRVGARRRHVAEHQARRRLRGVLVVMVLAIAAALAWWVSHSPLLAVDTIQVAGMERARALTLAEAGGLRAGAPILWVNPARIEAALRSDPRVEDARVSVKYPHTVTIAVLARRPIASVLSASGVWLAVTADGIVVAHEEAAADRATLVAAGVAAVRPGAALTAPELLAGLDFLAALPPDLAADAAVDLRPEGGVAEVAGHPAQLGGSGRMREKAGAVAALITTGLPEGAGIDVAAPDRPAVSVPDLDSKSTAAEAGGDRES